MVAELVEATRKYPYKTLSALYATERPQLCLMLKK